MQVEITAMRGNTPITFHVEGKNAQAAFAHWQSSPMSKGCTRGALGTKPAKEARAENRGLAKALTDGGTDSMLADIDGGPLASSKCQYCGVTTLQNKWNNSVSRVHKVGCSAAQPGDFVTSMNIGC